MVVTAKGTVLAYCEARRNNSSDWGEIEVHLRRSTDGGRTWDAPRQIAHRGPRMEGNPRKKQDGAREQTVNNPVAIVDRVTGNIEFVYCVNYARAFAMRSTDDGLTWSAPVEITATFEPFRKRYDWKVIATGPGHGLQLRSGRLVVPIWLAYGGIGDHKPSAAGTIYSDDHGKTWRAGDIAVPDEGEFGDPNETMITTRADGQVHVADDLARAVTLLQPRGCKQALSRRGRGHFGSASAREGLSGSGSARAAGAEAALGAAGPKVERTRPLGLAALGAPPCTVSVSLRLFQVMMAPSVSSTTLPARSRRKAACPVKRNVSLAASYSMRSAWASMCSSTPSRFCRYVAGWATVPRASALRAPPGGSRTSTRSARISIVPCEISALPLNVVTPRWVSIVPSRSASTTIGLLRSARSARAGPGPAAHRLAATSAAAHAPGVRQDRPKHEEAGMWAGRHGTCRPF
jgi:hypothetical protein